MTPSPDSGIVSLDSRHSVEQTVERLLALLAARQVKVFAVIDHSGEAAKVGYEMRPTKVVIFGNPKAGTPLMIASPTIAIDLPLKILVREDDDGRVRISWNSPAYLQARHSLPSELLANISIVEAPAAAAAR